MSHLPILVPGSTQPILVPCRLPPSIPFNAFLPSRGGVRPFCMWLSSTDPREAEVSDVTLAQPEKDPRLVLAGGAYALDEDETTRAWEAAGDVLADMLTRLCVPGPNRLPIGMPTSHILPCIAKAWEAEELAVSRATAVYALFLADKARNHAEDINKRIPDLTAPSGQETSAACEALRCYVDRAVDAACIAHADKADAQKAAHPSPDDDTAPSGSEHIRNERSLTTDMVTP